MATTQAPAPSKLGGVSTEAVKKATGRTWDSWIAALDRAGCVDRTHAEIARIVATKYRVSPWWSQMVTVGYEQAKGLRTPHQKPDGYSASVSRTLPVAARLLTDAFATPRARARWIPGINLELRTIRSGKSVRAAWHGKGRGNGTSIVSAHITPKTGGRSTIQINHDRLRAPTDVAKSKAYWAAAIDRLVDALS